MRVAIFTDSYLPTVDGVVNSIRNTKAQLEALGHHVVVLAPGRDLAGPVEAEDTLFCPARELKRYPGYRLALLPTKRELEFLQGHDVEIIHSHGIAFMGLKGLWAAREMETPLVETFHTNVLEALPYYATYAKSRFVRGLVALYLRHFLHHCGGVVAPSSAILKELHALAPRIRVSEVIPTGIDTTRFHPGVDGREVRDRWEVDGADLILYVGRVAPEKGIDLLLEAFARVRGCRPGSKLMVVGKGPALKNYIHEARRRFPWGDVIFTGFVPDEDLPMYYAACDAFALPSTFETQGLVLLEAMATGKAVAGVDYRAVPEFVQEGVTGHLAPPGDVEAFARAILKILEADGEMARAARRAAETYSVEAMTQRLLGLYQRLLEVRRGG
jgi:1,2-diacylglycerol 3-alpha-glucosyltransferase